ncbi:hypothetical protein ACFV06_16835 [Streptomyces sp. NPDC059618]|uniref:hypothetical protein n=1 Tax=Streptomyces sp. NPDC059618 TaxID=3346887 RepID=UPI00369E1436
MVKLSVPGGLPNNNNHMPGGPDIEPITLVLTNGACCSFAGGGTATLTGQRLNYGCDNCGYLYGYPNKTAALWTVSYAAPGSGASVATPITTCTSRLRSRRHSGRPDRPSDAAGARPEVHSNGPDGDSALGCPVVLCAVEVGFIAAHSHRRAAMRSRWY